MEPKSFVWPQQLEMSTGVLHCGHLLWGYGLPWFGVKFEVEAGIPMAWYSLMNWRYRVHHRCEPPCSLPPINFRVWTALFRCSPSTFGQSLNSFDEASSVCAIYPHAFIFPFQLGISTLFLWRGSALGNNACIASMCPLELRLWISMLLSSLSSLRY